MITKEESTKAAYLARAQSQHRAYEKKFKCLASENWQAFIDYLVTRKPDLSTRTWYYYKAANVYFFQANELHKEAEYLLSIDSRGTITSGQNTSSLKKKFISEKEENRIRELLQEGTNDDLWDKILISMFECLINTGMRPTELFGAEYKPESKSLKIRNAKNTNDRSFGCFRELDLSELEEKTIIYIQLAIRFCQLCTTPDGKKLTKEEFYDRCRKRFHTVTRKVTKKKSISFYSCRHQLIANLKFAGYSLKEIAATVGHGTDATASEHYGKRRFGRHRSGLPIPDKNDVLKIQSSFKQFTIVNSQLPQQTSAQD